MQQKLQEKEPRSEQKASLQVLGAHTSQVSPAVLV